MHKLGVIIPIHATTAVRDEMQKAKDLGFECCQISIWNPQYYTDRNAEAIVAASAETGIEVSTLWAGWTGPREWNFTGGPTTLGIVPAPYRMQRAEELIQGAAFAQKIGVTRVATHAGFLPENMTDAAFPEVVATLRYIMSAYKKLGRIFLFETGQETPVALLRIIEACGMDNVGINMDTANLILYGKGNSVDAIRVFGKYVMDTHIKDGFYPTDGHHLGKEVKVGEGLANIPEVMKQLDAVGYTGNYVIEREISGPQQAKDIAETKEYLKELLR